VPKERKLHDHYFKKAKEDGFAARSAYKLEEIQERHRILRPGNWVIDLGCAPGSWCQFAGKIVGKGPRGLDGRVLGIDLQAVDAPMPDCVQTVVGDVFKLTAAQCAESLGGLADVVLSDMAPGTTGDPTGDHFRSVALCRRVLELLPEILKPGGHLVMKVFEGESYMDLLRETQRLFGEAKGLKPRATREVSREMFIIAEQYQGPEAHKNVPPRDPRLAPTRPPPKAGW
jgi:23S rRNA (uridine2552-2'-O)-methyltransferase